MKLCSRCTKNEARTGRSYCQPCTNAAKREARQAKNSEPYERLLEKFPEREPPPPVEDTGMTLGDVLNKHLSPDRG